MNIIYQSITLDILILGKGIPHYHISFTPCLFNISYLCLFFYYEFLHILIVNAIKETTSLGQSQMPLQDTPNLIFSHDVVSQSIVYLICFEMGLSRILRPICYVNLFQSNSL